MLKAESSPFGSSPLATASPRLFWQGRDPASPSRENQSPYDAHSPVLTKRSSIEKLKQASRVKNSSMFAKEQSNHYDPSKPIILDRPLASGRPLSTQVQTNAYDGQGTQGLRKQHDTMNAAAAENDVDETLSKSMAPPSPSRKNISPAKSSLSKKSGFTDRHSGFDPETGIWNDDEASEKQLPEGRGLHRHAKSVTFDQAPPQVNEYEMTTPVPSSVASGSREGSYDSVGDEEVSFERGSSFDREDSFDASLEDTDKTPVVLPEDWRFMSPDIANTVLSQHEEDVFDDGEYGSPEPSAQPGSMDGRPHQTSLNSVDSNGQPRPLPPLPQNGSVSPERQQGFSSAIERMSNAQRCLPTPPQPPSITKSEIRRMSGGSMSLEERLRLMMLKEQDQQQPVAEQQRERRMRRAGSKDPSPVRDGHSISIDFDARDGSPGPAVLEDETESPKISRDSIIRRLRSEQDLLGFNGEVSEHTSHVLYDPDVPIPSLEDPTQLRVRQTREITIKQEEVEEVDLYSIPHLYAQSATDSEGEDGASQYSQSAETFNPPVSSDEGGETPRAGSPVRGVPKKSETSQRPSLPDFTDFGRTSSFDLDLSSYLTPPVEAEIQKTTEKTTPPPAILPDLSALRASIQKPFSPAEKFEPPHFSHSREDSIAEPGTPDSVIRHSAEDVRFSEIASPEATVKAPGARLNIRPSPAPADPAAMAATRRQVSGTVAAPPTASPSPTTSVEPEMSKSIQEPSTSEMAPCLEVDDKVESIPDAREPTKKRVSSLVQLDLPRDQSDEGLGLGLEAEFDRVLESQKVEFELSLQRLYHPFHGRFPPSERPDPKAHNPSELLGNIPLLPRPQGARAYPGDEFANAYPHPEIGMSHANRSPLRQRGYLMRQNTKVVIASERASEDEKRPLTAEKIPEGGIAAPESSTNGVQISPRKISQPTWTAEPWIGKSRRKSIRVGGDTAPVKRKPVQGPAPPLPGLASNVEDPLPDEDVLEDEAEDLEDGAERGRLFVKVMGVKELNLPLPDCKSCSPQLDCQQD